MYQGEVKSQNQHENMQSVPGTLSKHLNKRPRQISSEEQSQHTISQIRRICQNDEKMNDTIVIQSNDSTDADAESATFKVDSLEDDPYAARTTNLVFFYFFPMFFTHFLFLPNF